MIGTGKENNINNLQTGPQKTLKLLQSKGMIQSSEEATYKIGENLS